MSTLLLACAGPASVRETVGSRAEAEARAEARASARARGQGSSSSDEASGADEARAASDAPAPSPARARRADTRKTAAAEARKPAPEAARDAKTSVSAEPAIDEPSGADAFAGVDTEAPTDDEVERPTHTVAVRGIEGTMSEYDVRSTLESRDEDFDRCHDSHRGGSGRLEFRIHILANGDVGDVKVHRSKVHNSGLVDCYTDVVAASRFSPPHGGYADVKWTTKVGRSRKRPDALFERKVRWDTPASGGTSERSERSESSESRRERRHARRHRHGA